jgi:hypothetical protein
MQQTPKQSGFFLLSLHLHLNHIDYINHVAISCPHLQVSWAFHWPVVTCHMTYRSGHRKAAAASASSATDTTQQLRKLINNQA